MANEPVQVVLNPEALRAPRDVNRPNNNGKDFYADRDAAFVLHRDALVDALSAVASELRRSADGLQLGHLQVTMTDDAIAKSHRPQSKLFRSVWTPHVATAGIGQPIFAVTPAALAKVIEQVRKAEPVVEDRTDKNEVTRPYPTRNRCEVSAIDGVHLWSAADKRDFSAEAGAAWLSRADTGGAYLVELFPRTSATGQPDLAVAEGQAVAALRNTLLGLSVCARALNAGEQGEQTAAFTLQVESPGTPSLLELEAVTSDEREENAMEGGDLSFAPADHGRALLALGTNPLVRSISLPPVVVQESGQVNTPTRQAPGFIFEPEPEVAYAKVGVIDGGVDGPISSWVQERWGQLDDPDRELHHGTFISGLLVAAGQLNTYLDTQPHGCLVYDIDVLPDDPAQSGAQFAAYYPTGVPGFMDEIETAVEHFRATQSVRVFNFSINISSPGGSSRYGFAARRLDEISARLDVIFIVSAGNLNGGDQRSEWSSDTGRALASLASDRLGFLSEPGESLFNASVAALNPPGISGQVPFALARYSRRGPGLRGATKPDFAHVGGSGSPAADVGTNLFSVSLTGDVVSNMGTSFAAPLVARRLADLDQMIEGDVTRETLIALLVHHATTPSLLRTKELAPVARDLVGFGVPVNADQMLLGSDSEITLVFESVVNPGEQATMNFAWPAALVRDGACRGHARLTLVARPVLNHDHGDERIRVNIDAKLMQQQRDGGYKGQLSSAANKVAPDAPASERELLAEAFKWQVVKTFETNMPRGRGVSSNWKFQVEYLTRADEELPIKGVEFSAVLTIRDLAGSAPVFQQMRQILQQQGIRTADLRTNIRARAQV